MLKIDKKITKASQNHFCNAFVSMVKVYRNYTGMSIGITNFLLVFFHNLHLKKIVSLCFASVCLLFTPLYA